MQRILVTVALTLAVAAPLTVAHAQVVDDVFPMEPEDGATVGPRPVFRVGAIGRELIKMKFRIVVSQDDFDTEAYRFDWTEDAAGWVYTALREEVRANCELAASIYPRLLEALARRLGATRQQLLDLYGSEQREPW